ncbi:asparagine synthase-related protein [Frateuria hangzhouensis]|uniref:asparagine synthase-related protein n=1 Tax=Frateuria hangzhouensis TaxID=2995589 RepID=UPI002260983C|nr:asparagine synthase-related protein [Frateuria sp. STR12]MCX7513929.1 asparagine synthase-related protein [Frateuria sp. STR12]
MTSVPAQQAAAPPAERHVQLDLSPYGGKADLSALDSEGDRNDSIDEVSLADLLRNSFVYPPHSIFRGVKVATTGFDPDQDLHDHPRFHFLGQAAAVTNRPRAGEVDEATLVDTYHRLLSEAIERSTHAIRAPWLLQSGGKDSTSMAIALAETRPETTCVTYLGGTEENEVESARQVAAQLGLRHESLICDPARAYDRYLAMVPRIPLLTADFAVLSYADLVTEIASGGGDGIIDALGSDPYFGVPPHWQQRMLGLLARGVRLSPRLFETDVLGRNFKLCYALGTLQMNEFERFYAGSRFTDSEVDALFGCPLARQSRARLEVFRAAIAKAETPEARRRVSAAIVEAAIFGKGMFAAPALDLRLAYPYCDERLHDWVFRHVPDEYLMGPDGTNKVLVRRHIARHFRKLPYVHAKGSFRFDLCGLARQRFDQVHAFAVQAKTLLPGAPRWLEVHRGRLDNKYYASKFYLLAITLPWLLSRVRPGQNLGAAHTRGPNSQESTCAAS